MVEIAARLRAMTATDIPAVLPMEHDLFADQAWTRTMLEEELADSETRYYVVAVDDEEIVGYAGLAAYRFEAHVLTVGTRGDRQGEGIGRRLLGELLAEADRRKAERVILEVRSDNAPAIALYESERFVAVGVRKRYYQPGDHDAVVMVRE
ncbi:ribosomal-protein-alanine N-acetyltransferase [Antricoccus suffuscus]|uniref:[Ribosomal protein bS18]-alanine N-acetyltransferase n=1 Tax=Antricoccus suffuscus TaxID=1629062 RepID=A0A2T0Z363_9ACTN|nr:ribosomal protein S18-alanine N-acetyltransferase [Antricoccus suffuscus]PRZ30787.1 ribosomal-protein-alanine N-acetyltransferase [Antricoccus suffuscus]